MVSCQMSNECDTMASLLKDNFIYDEEKQIFFFQLKIYDFFIIFAQTIDCGYTSLRRF